MADMPTYNIKIDDAKRRDDIGGIKNLAYVVVTKRDGKELGRVERTFDDFLMLQGALKALAPSINLPLPAKKAMSMDMAFLTERLRGLTLFLDLLQEHRVLLHQNAVLDFVGLPGSGSAFLDMLTRDGPVYIRSELDLTLHTLLPYVGSRNNKLYHKISLPEAPNAWMVMVAKGPDCTLSDDNLKLLLQAMVTIQHPFIAMMVRGDVIREKNVAVISRRFEQRGSLKDIIHASNPTDPYPKKYFGKNAGRPLDPLLARTYARQLLEGLAYLHKKGWPYGHLHSGNVLVDNRKCRLSDLENCVLGIPPLHLDRLLAWKRCTNVWEADVVGFGAVLYEMVIGEELPLEGLPARFPESTSERVKDVLESIFRASKPLPTIDDLLKTNYIASVEIGDLPSEFKRTTKIKDLQLQAVPQYQTMLANARAAAKGLGGSESRMPRKQSSLRSLSKARTPSTQHLQATQEIDLSAGAASKPVTAPVAPRPVQAGAGASASTIAIAGSAKPGPAPPTQAPPSAVPGAPTSSPSPTPKAASAPAAAPKAASSPAPAAPKAAGPPPPPPPPAPPAPGGSKSAAPPPPPPPPAGFTPPPEAGDRSSLLSSIANFKGGLKKTKTNDRSKPKV